MTKKIQIMYAFLFAIFFILVALFILKIKYFEESQQKIILAQEIHKALRVMMPDLILAHESTIQDVPADGQWYHHIVFDTTGQGILEYNIKERQLFRINNGKAMFIADQIDDLRLRREKETPDILEVQIEAKKNVSLVYNLRIKVNK